MSLTSVPLLFELARARGYALGYFESWNLESLQGVIDAAEQTRSPVLVGFNGEFLTHPHRLAIERIELYGALGLAAAESASVPCGVVFNECASDDHIKKALQSGFNLVMLSDPDAGYDEYVRRTKNLVIFAHEFGVAFEAEIGELPIGASGTVMSSSSSKTDPELAAQFVSATGVDLLNVSVGNIHILINGEQALDLTRLEEIHKRVDIPLGLHGGTGISAVSLQAAIRMGVVKVAYGTYLKQSYLAALRRTLSITDINPHKLLGMGGYEDVLVAGRYAVRDAVLERIELLGCCGRA
jgi:ketose-bisphosphate aldolase